MGGVVAEGDSQLRISHGIGKDPAARHHREWASCAFNYTEHR